jgi:hypothetical protein
MRAMRAPLAMVPLLLLLASGIACRREEPIPPEPRPVPSPAAVAEPAAAPAADDEAAAGDDETPAEGLAAPTDEEPPAGPIGK